MLVRVGACVRTNYGTGPYIVEKVGGPCTCPEYIRSINGDERPSKLHFHLTARPVAGNQSDHWLNGYTLEGRSVWNGDRLIDASQLELF